ncbi:MAG: glycosyltransferase family 39 protein [Thermoleophilia bacterium]|nr:glycosyltransferase family 39 protein [Thermoleophilia bacterium]
MKKINPEIFWLLVIFLLALTLRIISVFFREMIRFDEASFLSMAENLLLGKAPYDITGTTTTHYSILYPLVTASFAVALRSTTAAAYAVSVLFGALLVLPTYLFGKVMWNKRVARRATALVAVLPPLVASGSLIDGQSLFAFWLMCALFFGYRMLFTKRCLCGMLSGTSLGIAYLVDPSALYYLVVLLPLLVIVGLRQELANYANKAAVHFLLMFLIFAIPNVVFMTWQNGAFTLSDRPTDQIHAAVNKLTAGSLKREQDHYALTPAGELRLNEVRDGNGIFTSFADSPGRFAKAALQRDYNVFIRNINSLVPVWLLPLIGLGIFRFAWTRREALKYGYFTLALAPLIVLPVVWGDTRFAIPYLGIVMLGAAKGWLYLEEWGIQSMEEMAGWKSGDARRKWQVQAAVGTLLLAPLVVMSLWGVARTDYPLEFRQAGERIAELGIEEPVVMSREASSAWYAGGSQLVMPYASIEETLDYGERHGADCLVIHRGITDELRPQLRPLLDTDNPYLDRLEPVYHSGQGTDEELIVYRFPR